jgi:hypothetical protein
MADTQEHNIDNSAYPQNGAYKTRPSFLSILAQIQRKQMCSTHASNRNFQKGKKQYNIDNYFT